MISGCPTAISPAEVDLLQQYARGKRVLEMGALLGYSTIKLAEVASHVVSIDMHEGYRGKTYWRYMSNLERAGIRHKVTPVLGDAIALTPMFDCHEFYFIDLTGIWKDTRDAIKAIPACPALIGIHDFGRQNCTGVELAVSSLRCTIIDKAETLVIAVKW